MKAGTYSKPRNYTGGIAERQHPINKLSDLAFTTGLQVGMAMRERAQLEKDKNDFQVNTQEVLKQLLTAQAQLKQQQDMASGAAAPTMGAPMGAPPMQGAPPAGQQQAAPDISQFLPQPPQQ